MIERRKTKGREENNNRYHITIPLIVMYETVSNDSNKL